MINCGLGRLCHCSINGVGKRISPATVLRDLESHLCTTHATDGGCSAVFCSHACKRSHDCKSINAKTYCPESLELAAQVRAIAGRSMHLHCCDGFVRHFMLLYLSQCQHSLHIVAVYRLSLVCLNCSISLVLVLPTQPMGVARLTVG
jgi:hypothetical protein